MAGRLKREEARIAKEIEEREQEEARKMLEAAQKKIGAKRLNIAEGATLDKVTLMNQARHSPPPAHLLLYFSLKTFRVEVSMTLHGHSLHASPDWLRKEPTVASRVCRERDRVLP